MSVTISLWSLTASVSLLSLEKRGVMRPDANSTGRIAYQCVCGKALRLDPDAGGVCSACGRAYSGDIARLAAGETFQLPPQNLLDSDEGFAVPLLGELPSADGDSADGISADMYGDSPQFESIASKTVPVGPITIDSVSLGADAASQTTDELPAELLVPPGPSAAKSPLDALAASPATGSTGGVTLTASDGGAPAAPTQADLPEDRTLGHFRIVSRLGRGGMGDVYRALDESLQREVALKVLRPNANGPAGAHAGAVKLLQEARAQARVNHSGVVHIYYVSMDPQRPFLAMELVNGITLADRLCGGALDYAAVLDIALQIVRALRHAALFDVVHGDIKPGNILLSTDQRLGDTAGIAPDERPSGAEIVKLGDFGLARRLSGGDDVPAGPLTGTPHYLPPEILAGAEPGIRGDMYSLGIMLFEMTFGRTPYRRGGTLREEIEGHRSAPVEWPDPWPEDVPEAWRDVLARLLEKNPENRYANYDALLAELERVRPIDLPQAGKFIRGMAGSTDLFLASAARGLIVFPFLIPTTREALAEQPLTQLALTLLAGLVPPAVSYLQALWKTTPGKVLFQLRIVDRHGLTPGAAVLAARAVFQMLPAWANSVFSIFALGLHTEAAGFILGGTLLLGTVADAAVALVRRDSRTIHDLLLGTQVVLDTRQDDEHV